MEKRIVILFALVFFEILGWIIYSGRLEHLQMKKEMIELERIVNERNHIARINHQKHVERQACAPKLILSKQYCGPKMITGSDHQLGKPWKKRTPRYTPMEWRIYFRNLRTGEEDGFRITKTLFDSLNVDERIDTIKTLGLIRF